MTRTPSGVRISFAAQQKPATSAGFINYNKNFAKSLPRFVNYRMPRIVKSKDGWYVEYYYRVPAEVRPLYEDKEWVRFRVREDINRRSGIDREQYAEWLLSELATQLRNGFNPFENEIEHVKKESAGVSQPDDMCANDALLLFLKTWKERGLDSDSYGKYRRHVMRLIGWLEQKKMLYGDVNNITVNHMEFFLSDMRRQHKYSNRESNNCYDFIRTAFKFLLKKKIINESPCAGIDKLKANTSKHRFYDEANLKAITKALLASDPYTYLAFQTVYYLCVRSDKELMNLKVGNIQWEQNKILTTPEGSKGKAARYIPMDENIKKLFMDHGINKYSGSFFIFGINGAPAAAPFGRGFFSKRFKKVRKAAGLPDWFTMYGAKHTRVIHLKSDGVSDANIMALTGHKDFTAYAKYLRDLGLTVNIKDLNEKSRVI